MIARIWRAEATPEGADAYRRHFMGAVLPALERIAGFRGAYLLVQPGERVGIEVMSLWESLEAVSRFAGPDIGVAVVEPEARAVLASYETSVSHHEVVAAPPNGPSPS